MKKYWLVAALSIVTLGGAATPAFAIKQFGEAWDAYYVKESKNDDFKKLAGDAKCNVCHIKEENKKKHNPYGDALHEFLKKKDFPGDRFKKEPEKCKEEIEAAFKKAEEAKNKDGKTFGELIKDGKLPGGNVDGK